VPTCLYTASFTIDPGRTVTEIALPATVTGGRLHVFSVGFGGHRDSAGISDDGHPDGADFDEVGFSYSREALAAAGLTSGATIMHNGVAYTWPTAASNDNYRAAGQTIAVPARPGSSRLGVLGAADGSFGGSFGTATIRYDDGMSQQVTLGFSDWTLAGGTESVNGANTMVARTPYRNSARFGRSNTATYIFAVTFDLPPGRVVQAVTLPTGVPGRLHVFAFGTG
jgi:hypothetical protein